MTAIQTSYINSGNLSVRLSQAFPINTLSTDPSSNAPDIVTSLRPDGESHFTDTGNRQLIAWNLVPSLGTIFAKRF